MKTALLIRSAYLNTQAFDRIMNELSDAARQQNVRLLIKKNDEFLSSDALNNLPSAGIFWDKDIRLARLIEQEGVVLMNSSNAIALCDDKTLTYLALRGHVEMPETLLCPLSYEGGGKVDCSYIDAVAQRLGFPFIIKEGRGSFGHQVYLVQNTQEAYETLQKIGPKPALCQRFIGESAGRDVRAYVVGGRVVASIQRTSTNGDFRANIGSGGTARPYTLSKEGEDMCIKACELLRLDFAGVDLLFSKDGPLLCEVNSNAHFAGLEQATGISPAPFIIERLRTLL